MTLERTACAEWPRILAPAKGALPPAAVLREPERVLYVALRDSRERLPGLRHAIGELSTVTADIDWVALERRHGTSAVPYAVCQAAAGVRPTLVFMQIQRGGVMAARHVDQLRLFCDPSVVIIQWDGDQHYGPHAPERKWFCELGSACDASLLANTSYLDDYAKLGVKRPGFLTCGYDEAIYRPAPAAPNTPRIVFLANNYDHLPAYDRRRAMVAHLAARVPSLGVYGGNWSGAHARPWLRQHEESPVYSAAAGAISMSIDHQIERCTSGRLFRALGSGACVLVERFPDMEGLGLVDGVNCLVWSTFDELTALCAHVQLNDMSKIRGAALEMSLALHTWSARTQEIMAMVYAIRDARRQGR